MFRIARRVAKDRVISTVDPDARHGHKTARGGSTATRATPRSDPDSRDHHCHHGHPGQHRRRRCRRGPDHRPPRQHDGPHRRAGHRRPGTTGRARVVGRSPSVYGDAAYGTGEFHEQLGEAGIESRCKTQAPTAAGGLFSKDRFGIDLAAMTATCPAGVSAPIRCAPQRRRWRDRLLRAGLRRVPAACAVHHREGRAHDQRRPARAGAGRCPGPAGRSGLGRRLPGDPPEG